MAKFRQVYSQFWNDPKVLEEFTPEDKFFFLYLLTNLNTKQIGVYQITKKQMAFEMGYSQETINSLMERFVHHHELVVYNAETREIAIKNWGKYNLNRGGKPVYDLLQKELREVKDKSLVALVAEHIENPYVKAIFDSHNDPLHDSSDDSSTTRGTKRGQEEEEEEEEEKEEEGALQKSSKYKFEPSHMKLSELLLREIRRNNPDFKEPNLESWANEFRLMMERDNREGKVIQDIILFSQGHEFWHVNILSVKKLRKQFDRLLMEKAEAENPKKGDVKNAESSYETDYSQYDFSKRSTLRNL